MKYLNTTEPLWLQIPDMHPIKVLARKHVLLL